jgi:Protein of unknown function (DUF4026) C-terminal/Uncharacterized protein conserved in bacteria (DUF2314)
MFSWLNRDVPATGHVLYPGLIPPPIEQFTTRRQRLLWTPTVPSADRVWSAEATDSVWGRAEIACLRRPTPLPPELLHCATSLSNDEKARAETGGASLEVRISAQHKNILRDRKRLLFWLQTLMSADSAVAVDDSSMLMWSRAMLDDELAHDADLDIESLYTIHAVQDSREASRVQWLHTHGLEQLGAFDIDMLQPSPAFVSNCSDPVRAIAFAALDHQITPDVERFPLALPGGDVRLVAADRYHADAAAEHRALREADDAHSGRRTVVCEPVGGLFARWRTRPVPSRFISNVHDMDGFVIPFSTSATELMAERAKQTLSVFRALKQEFASLDLPAVVKLGYQVEGGGPSDREHLWFAVHHILGDTVDATLVNTPHRVPELKAEQRGEFALERLTDWTILSPEGSMTPRNVSAARRLRSRNA